MNEPEYLTPEILERERRRRGEARAWVFLRVSVWLGSLGLTLALVFRSDVALIVGALGLFSYPLAETHKYAPKHDSTWTTAARKTQWIVLALMVAIGVTSLFLFDNYGQCFSGWGERPNPMVCE